MISNLYGDYQSATTSLIFGLSVVALLVGLMKIEKIIPAEIKYFIIAAPLVLWIVAAFMGYFENVFFAFTGLVFIYLLLFAVLVEIPVSLMIWIVGLLGIV
jgi:hypothetical protein